MSTPNTYTRSGACRPGGGNATQNVAFAWADASPGELTALQRWAGGRLLLLVFGDVPSAMATRLRALSMQADLRCVQVLAATGKTAVREHVRDIHGHLRATCEIKTKSHAWALLRPDSYIAASGERLDASLLQALAAAMGTEK